jgi:MOSC domain-containing protein YiiM
MIHMGKIVSIWIKRAHGGPMDRVVEAEMIAGRGLSGNADQGGWRQVTLIDEGAWAEAQVELGVEVDPSARRANVLLRDVNLEESRGKTLRVGDCRIRILGETRPCHQMDHAYNGLRDVLRAPWRAGAFGEIVEGGIIHIGDAAAWTEE